jgi:hypothetical protein
MSAERNSEDLALLRGGLPAPAEILRRSLAAQLRIEDLVTEQLAVSREILAELRARPATPAEGQPAPKPRKPPTS